MGAKIAKILSGDPAGASGRSYTNEAVREI
jgi:hypothetical protein